MAFCKISLERTSNNLACALQCFFCLFCACFVLLKTGHSNRNLTKKGLKIESFLQKTKKFFAFFFWDPRPKSQTLTTRPCPPPFWKFFIRYIEQWTKTFCKKTGRPGRSSGNDFKIYRSGWKNPNRFHLCFVICVCIFNVQYNAYYCFSCFACISEV